MRRDFRRKKQEHDKIMIYSITGIMILLTIVFGLLMYGDSLNKEVKNSQLSSEQIASITNNETNTQSVSSSIGKTVEEKEKENIQTNTTTNNTTNTTANTPTTNTTSNTLVTTTSNEEAKQVSSKKVEPNLTFQLPVQGEIVREFTQDSLVYSDTLQEWITHNGIDIKAEKATVVEAAEDGTVKTIKNDPRFGLTIIIEHDNGFQTVYANLLSTEFVTEKEQVKKGQSIGTIGNTASFESADEPHLHFEIIKDSVQVNPNLYIK